MTTILSPSKNSSQASLVPAGGSTENNTTTSPIQLISPRTGHPLRFKAFPYTGENDFTILCGHDYLSVGGGEGKYGMWLDDRMARGVSDACPTFDNEPLSETGTKFEVLGVELWYVGS